MNRPNKTPDRFPAPPAQTNLSRAAQLAFQALTQQSPEQLEWLGAEVVDGLVRLSVLEDTVHVDVEGGRVITASAQDVGPHWQILVLHYLKIGGRPEPRPPEITFADLQTARSYNDVYRGRTVGRLCATVGRQASSLVAAAESLAGRPAEGGDIAFDFPVFPRLTLRLVWHAPDEEFPSSATILLPRNIESFFCAEDIVVLSERLVSRLCGGSL